jgi:ATPase related to the helicase subunit of the Holliday junction resolvase
LKKIGLPEGRIPMIEAIIYVCESEKSNTVVKTMYSAIDAVEHIKVEEVPLHLRDGNYKQEKITGYKYPHDYGGYIKQQYLPDELKDEVFYEPSDHGFEAVIRNRQIRLGKLK